MLSTKKCNLCATRLLTYAHSPHCTNCIKSECCLSNYAASDGRMCCNVTFDMITIDQKKYCLGHYKLLQNKCNVCGLTRPESCHNFQDDHMWYCKDHTYVYKYKRTQAVFHVMKDILCIDLITEILKKSLGSPNNKYPDKFHIPLKKSLK